MRINKYWLNEEKFSSSLSSFCVEKANYCRSSFFSFEIFSVFTTISSTLLWSKTRYPMNQFFHHSFCFLFSSGSTHVQASFSSEGEGHSIAFFVSCWEEEIENTLHSKNFSTERFQHQLTFVFLYSSVSSWCVCSMSEETERTYVSVFHRLSFFSLCLSLSCFTLLSFFFLLFSAFLLSRITDEHCKKKATRRKKKVDVPHRFVSINLTLFLAKTQKREEQRSVLQQLIRRKWESPSKRLLVAATKIYPVLWTVFQIIFIFDLLIWIPSMNTI